MERHPTPRPKKRTAVAVGDLVSRALRDLGMPSKQLTRRVDDAWARAADPAWVAQVRPLRIEGGVLLLGVASASLRQELALFHHDRLLAVLRTALPDVPLVALRFVADVPSAGGERTDAGDK